MPSIFITSWFRDITIVGQDRAPIYEVNNIISQDILY